MGRPLKDRENELQSKASIWSDEQLLRDLAKLNEKKTITPIEDVFNEIDKDIEKKHYNKVHKKRTNKTDRRYIQINMPTD